MNQGDHISLVHRFFPGTGRSYDHIADLCTLGFDGRWKTKMLAKIPDGSTRIMDQACGTGILTCMIARRFPGSEVTGVDMLDEYLAIAKEKAKDRGLSNTRFILGRAEDVSTDRELDCVTSSYLAKYAGIDLLIGNIKRMMREGGTLIMHDFTYPGNRFCAGAWESWFKLLQTIGARRYPQWKRVFDDLPGFLRETRWVDELVRSLRENSFSDIAVEYFTCGVSAMVTAKKA